MYRPSRHKNIRDDVAVSWGEVLGIATLPLWLPLYGIKHLYQKADRSIQESMQSNTCHKIIKDLSLQNGSYKNFHMVWKKNNTTYIIHVKPPRRREETCEYVPTNFIINELYLQSIETEPQYYVLFHVNNTADITKSLVLRMETTSELLSGKSAVLVMHDLFNTIWQEECIDRNGNRRIIRDILDVIKDLSK